VEGPRANGLQPRPGKNGKNGPNSFEFSAIPYREVCGLEEVCVNGRVTEKYEFKFMNYKNQIFPAKHANKREKPGPE